MTQNSMKTAQSAPAARVVFTGANLIDGIRPASPAMTGVVSGERIEAVLPDSD